MSGPGGVNGPRIPPGRREDIGLVNTAITRIIGVAAGGSPPHLFTTLARHRGLFRRWLFFAGGLMPGGVLPRIDAELVILRVAHNCGSEYEARHHRRLGALAGLTDEEIARVPSGPDADGWSPRQVLLLRAADELHAADRSIGDELWAALAAELDERERIELPLLVGHYEMLAMTLNALRVEPDREALGPSGRAGRLLQRLAERRR